MLLVLNSWYMGQCMSVKGVFLTYSIAVIILSLTFFCFSRTIKQFITHTYYYSLLARTYFYSSPWLLRGAVGLWNILRINAFFALTQSNFVGFSKFFFLLKAKVNSIWLCHGPHHFFPQALDLNREWLINLPMKEKFNNFLA